MSFDSRDIVKLYRTRAGAVVRTVDGFYSLGSRDWDALVNRDDLHAHLASTVSRTRLSSAARGLAGAEVLAPIGTQEVWAAGVTYLRSRDARVAESAGAGGDDCYTRVYDAERPELFFKGTPHRIAHPGGPMRLRRDSTWNVPEPELTLFITSSGKIVAYTIGNDLSSRSIEGENPLYLPQAKTWDLSAALGPCLYVPAAPLSADTPIDMQILRAGAAVFQGDARVNQMKRTFEELAEWLTRECTFPCGVFLMTGTGIVPPDGFTLEPGDEVRIAVPPIGVLANHISA